jgi:hypothetical protein
MLHPPFDAEVGEASLIHYTYGTELMANGTVADPNKARRNTLVAQACAFVCPRAERMLLRGRWPRRSACGRSTSGALHACAHAHPCTLHALTTVSFPATRSYFQRDYPEGRITPPPDGAPPSVVRLVDSINEALDAHAAALAAHDGEGAAEEEASGGEAESEGEHKAEGEADGDDGEDRHSAGEAELDE